MIVFLSVYVRSGINVAIVAAKSGITYDIGSFVGEEASMVIQSLLKKRACIVSFESEDFWFDIGTMEDQEVDKEIFGKN